jgi:benzoate membrane transport protein
MTADVAPQSSRWVSLTITAFATVIVGFASTILVVIQGAKAVGASPAQQASTAAALCFAMAATSFVLAYRYKLPIITAWSTPGSALMATSAMAITFPQAIGAFLFAAVLMILTALIKPLADAINRMPSSVAAAMLAGVLFRFVLGVPGAALELPYYVVPLVIVFFALRVWLPIYAIPVVVVLGVIFAVMSGTFAGDIHYGITPLEFVWPAFDAQAIIGLGLPLYLVTMASQNLPGFAVLKANGYTPPVSACLAVTGVGSLLAAPFGSHAVNMAAITAAMGAGPDCHPDPAQRWKITFPYTAIYVLFGLAAGTFVSVLGALPTPLIAAVAGLALFAPLMGGISAMTKEPKEIEAALVTFLVTASGISLFGVGAAFWGLVCGLALWFVRRASVRS